MRPPDYDVLVIGSGFGGSVTALRLTEKGYRVGVLEAGRRFTADTFPKTSWNLRRFLWAPKLGCRGIQRITLLRNVLVLSGAGVGGGSLVYANVLYDPLPPFFEDPQWRHIADWKEELAPHYETARRMLGATVNPIESEADRVVREVAGDMGVGETWHPTSVGVWFDRPGEVVPDPFFGGDGPPRAGCIACGACMTGCRHGAKNTLDTNYLHLAEKKGAVVHPEHLVVDLRAVEGGGWEVTTRRPGLLGGKRRHFRANDIVFSAGALGTQKLLHRLRAVGRLPNLSPRLGELTRTNSEALLGATARNDKVDHSEGIAIGSSFHPAAETHIEPVRYGKGSNAMGLLATIMVDGGGGVPRWLRFLATTAIHPFRFLRSLSVRRWSERSIILLVMQSIDNSLRVYGRRGLFGWRLTSEQGHGRPNPTWIPVGNEVARRVAQKIGGDPASSINEAVLDIPMTAHILGGCVIGDSPETGVIDPYHRVFGHPGLHVADGSAITANLGANPSLTITAMTERAMSFWPRRGEPDTRPPVVGG